MAYEEKILELKNTPDKKIAQLLVEHRIALTVDEAKKIVKLLGRNPTLTEATIWGIQGSEHSSYKSSRRHLKMLPTTGPNVILGPSEDAGIIEIAKEEGKKGRRFGLVVSHESHNHPSQVVPYEGAATGVGGCVRDVLCMGAQVVGVADGLRFGEVKNTNAKMVAEGVVDGVAGYGNPIGVPNIAGDTYYNETFNDNCLVNVVALGILSEDEIIHSRAPKGAGEKGYEIILVGKPTDMSGMGGASFASLTLKEDDQEKNKGAVQEPNPFLKRHVMQSTYDLFRILKEKDLIDTVGFKDLGAGGAMCASVEMVAHSGYGANIDLDKLHVALDGLPAHVVACAETQERMCWIVPKELTKLILKHYNETWALPHIAKGAGASVIGKVTKGNYVLTYRGTKVCDAKPDAITEGLLYNRPTKPRKFTGKEPKFGMPRDLKDALMKVISHENVACRAPIYESYDKNVQGISVIEAGDADAGVIAPLRNRDDVTPELQKIGVALKLDANPRYGQIDPYLQAASAVVEGCRNVAAVGALPICITDCLNYGNPEKPDQMWELVRGVEGIRDALQGIGLIHVNAAARDAYNGAVAAEKAAAEAVLLAAKNAKAKRGRKAKPKPVKKEKIAPLAQPIPLPCISGNVSLYNLSPRGAIAPQALIATIGRMENVERAITQRLKEAGNHLFLLGPRKDELGGSVYYDVQGELGANVPNPDFELAAKEIELVVDLINKGLVESCHDISDGGLATTLTEMCLGGRGDGRVGAKVVITTIDERPLDKQKKAKYMPLRTDKKLFSETGGFVLEINRKNVTAARRLAEKLSLPLIRLGFTTEKRHLVIFDAGKEVINVKLSALRAAWTHGLREKLA